MPPSSEASQNWQAFTVACDSYQLHEEERYGGYATFDINFVEAGQLPIMSGDWQNILQQSIDNFLSQVMTQMSTPNQSVKPFFGPDLVPILPGFPRPNGQSRFNRSQARLRFGP